MDKARLERELSTLSSFTEPSVELEQYPTPDWLAAHLVHLADTQDDVAGRTVVDLGTGTGMLALAASVRGPRRVIALERDPSALAVARTNERGFSPPQSIDWVIGDATRLPLSFATPITVVMNPPFGAQKSNVHADREFLDSIAELARDVPVVSYSIHNANSRTFVESYTADNGAEITHAFEAEFDLDRQFEFQREEQTAIAVEIFRIVWH